MADIGGYPVHNYGTDPLGRMGVEMFKSSLDWDEKQKELERRATIEAATQQRGAFIETVKGGTAPPGVASQLYGPQIGGGVDRLSQQNQIGEEIKRLSSVIKMNTDQQTYTEKQVTSIESAQEKIMKRKLELMDVGGQEDMVVYMNDQLKAMDAKVSQLRGFNVGSSVLASDLASWKTTKQEEATKQIAALGTELKTAMGANEPDSEAIGAASAKLQAAVTTMQQKWKLPKETFTLESKLLGEADETMRQVITAKLKPKEPKPLHYQDLGNRVEVSDAAGNVIKTVQKGKLPRDPDEMAKVGNIRAVGLNLAAEFFPLAKANMGADADKLSEGLFMTDQFGQTVNEARLRNYLTPEQRGAYKWIKIEAEKRAADTSPANAVDMALKAYHAKFPNVKLPEMGKTDTERESAEAAITAGKDPVAVKEMYEKRTGKKY